MKLLNRSIRLYLTYSAIVLIIAMPVLYIVIQSLVGEDVDESLAVQRAQITAKLENTATASYFNQLETFEPDISITRLPAFYAHDTLYTIKIYDSISNEIIPYRVLESVIKVHDTPFLIRLQNSLLDSEELIASLAIVIFVMLICIAGGLIAITRKISKKIWSPFYTTLANLHKYQIEKNELIPFEKTSINEFSDLNKAITSLTQRNQQVYQSQKEFTENASHELQTPLAIFQAKVELLMQTMPLHNEQAELIADLSDASQRMNRLNKNLLLLTRIDNDLFPEKEQLSIRQIMEKLVDQYQYQVKKKNIALDASYSGDDSIIANRSLIEIMLNNLFSNAIRYNKINGEIHLSLKDRILTIQNTGLNGPLNTEKIFNRFYKEASDPQSVGLGLAIAKKISTVCNFDLSYQHSGDLHSFSLRV